MQRHRDHRELVIRRRACVAGERGRQRPQQGNDQHQPRRNPLGVAGAHGGAGSPGRRAASREQQSAARGEVQRERRQLGDAEPVERATVGLRGAEPDPHHHHPDPPARRGDRGPVDAAEHVGQLARRAAVVAEREQGRHQRQAHAGHSGSVGGRARDRRAEQHGQRGDGEAAREHGGDRRARHHEADPADRQPRRAPRRGAGLPPGALIRAASRETALAARCGGRCGAVARARPRRPSPGEEATGASIPRRGPSRHAAQTQRQRHAARHEHHRPDDPRPHRCAPLALGRRVAGAPCGAVPVAGTCACGEPGPAVANVNDVLPDTGCPSADTTR